MDKKRLSTLIKVPENCVSYVDGKWNVNYGIYTISKELVENGELIVQFGRVEGDFYCNGLGLTTLKGVPEYIRDSFDCSYNKISDFSYCPTYVGKYFVCSNNLITSLKGIQEVINKSLICHNNMIKDFIGFPTEIKGSLNCSFNWIESMQGCPDVIGDILDCSFNNISDLIGCTQEIPGDFICSYNNLKSLANGPHKVGGLLICEFNNIETFENVNILIGVGLITSNKRKNNKGEIKYSLKIENNVFSVINNE